jgi:ATP-dependent RNA helicase RhlE
MTTEPFSLLHPDVRRAIADLGFTRPTEIQAKAIPPALAGRDILAAAMTGSGKTAAFLLPILERLLRSQPGTTRALVLSPTRELAAQTVEHFEALARHTRLRAAAVYGGVSAVPQARAFRRGVDLVVACPGRLLDHFSHSYAALSGLEVLVLDEADRMLDMGFLPDIRRVLRHLPRVEQTMLFSATLPRPIVTLSRELLDDPVCLDVERAAAPATGVQQALYPVRQDLKASLLVELLRRGEIDNGLVFTRTKRRADRLFKTLAREGISCDRIHGDRSQGQRTRALADFKTGRTRVLVATDIAARGIDVDSLSHVVNFDVPHLPEDYIHRVGRTARASATGEAFTFVSADEQTNVQAIERAVGQRIPRRELAGFDADGAAAPPSRPHEVAAPRGLQAPAKHQGHRPAGRPAGPRSRSSAGEAASRPAGGRTGGAGRRDGRRGRPQR